MTVWPEPMLALMTPAELPAIDGYMADNGVSGFMLMERAGAAIADAAATLAPKAQRIVVIAGPTNNGGDSLSAARILNERGRDVTVALFADRDALKGDPATAASHWTGNTVRAAPEALAAVDLIIDGIFGGGHREEIAGAGAALIAAVNAAGLPVLAVDFPTGISGATGSVLGTAVKADMTVTFYCLKPGHLLRPGRSHCGTVVVDDIGIPASVMGTVKPMTFQNRPDLWRQSVPAAGLTGISGEATDVRILNPAEAKAGGTPLERARRAAAEARSVVVAFGPDPIVASPDGRACIAGHASADGYAAKEREALAGAIAACRSARMEAFEAAAAATWALAETGPSANTATLLAAIETARNAPAPAG